MASYAPLLHSIWEDDDFRALTPEAKLLYVLLISHRKLSRCGVLDLMPERWAKASGLDMHDLDQALGELEAARYVLIDTATGELAVRSKVKNDLPGSWTQVKSVWRAWEQVESRWLRETLTYSFPAVCWEHPDKAHAPCESPSGTPPDTPADRAWHTPTDTPSQAVSDTPTDTPGRVTAPSPSPCTLTSHPAPSSSESATTDEPPEPAVDDDHAARLNQQLEDLARQDLARREAEKGPVGDPNAWIRASIAGHRRRHEADPDYLDRCMTSAASAPPPTPVDGTIAASLARMHANAARDAEAPPPDPQLNHTGLAAVRATLHPGEVF